MSSAPARGPSEHERERTEALLETAEQLGQMGNWEWVPQTGELIWSENHFRLFGLEPNEVKPTEEFLIERVHPEDRERVIGQTEHLRAGGMNRRRFEYRIVREDGQVRQVRSIVTEIEAEPRHIIGFVQDITERRRAEREIQTHTAVAEALGRWESLQRSGDSLLQALGEAMDFVAGAIWLPEGEFLVAHAYWQASSVDESELEFVARGRRIPRGVGLLGRVWASGQPGSMINVTGDASFEPHELGELAGLHGAVAFPALEGEDVVAVLKFYSREEFQSTDRLMQSLIGIGREFGHFLGRRRAELGASALTPRELQVLQLGSQGNSVLEIATKLVVSRDTVKTHFRHAYSKLDVHDRAEAVALAIRLGLIE